MSPGGTVGGSGINGPSSMSGGSSKNINTYNYQIKQEWMSKPGLYYKQTLYQLTS